MAIIPDFLLKRVYKKGSLRETAEGIAFDLKNILGPGIIVGINFIKINDINYESPFIRVITQGVSTAACHISPDNPMCFKLNQETTCILEGAKSIKEGLNKIIVELITRDVGKVQVTLTDMI